MLLRDIFSLPAFCSSICTQFLAPARSTENQRGGMQEAESNPESDTAAKPRLPKIFGGSGNESWPGFQTSPSPLTGNGNTVKANNGLQPSGRHNKVNHPYQDGSSARVQQISVWIISWIDFICCCICTSLCSKSPVSLCLTTR